MVIEGRQGVGDLHVVHFLLRRQCQHSLLFFQPPVTWAGSGSFMFSLIGHLMQPAEHMPVCCFHVDNDVHWPQASHQWDVEAIPGRIAPFVPLSLWFVDGRDDTDEA
ncbi:Uncharacterised protein [Hafnia alvei]|uniref:Uncharacterized protein n=1 Tax=Hafnia alvei TaxID=569 RepID=A0A377PPP8_HAFAL|nr:Uncharacterised protein [Hafnia alvei]